MQYTKLGEKERVEALATLAAMIAFVREQFAALAPEEARAPGPRGIFSPVEQVWHLADLEREGFGQRIRRLREERNPHLPDFDGTKAARERRYRDLSLAEGLRQFEAVRAANLVALESVPPDAWTHEGTLEGVGAIHLCDLPAFMRQHDEAHIDEIRQWSRHVGRTN